MTSPYQTGVERREHHRFDPQDEMLGYYCRVCGLPGNWHVAVCKCGARDEDDHTVACIETAAPTVPERCDHTRSLKRPCHICPDGTPGAGVISPASTASRRDE